MKYSTINIFKCSDKCLNYSDLVEVNVNIFVVACEVINFIIPFISNLVFVLVMYILRYVLSSSLDLLTTVMTTRYIHQLLPCIPYITLLIV